MRPPKQRSPFQDEEVWESYTDQYYDPTPDEDAKISALLNVPGALGLDFDDEAMRWLGYAAKYYLSNTRPKSTPPASEASATFRKILKNAKRLADALDQNISCKAWMDLQFHSERNSERALWGSRPLPTLERGHHMLDLVDDLKTTIKAADFLLEHGAPHAAPPGRPKQNCLRTLVVHLLGVWELAGRTDSYYNTGSTYSGPLFDFVDACLKALGLNYANTTVGDMIKAERKRQS